LKAAKRDELVLSSAQNTKSCTSFYGRWLSPDIKTIIEAHANTYRAAKDISKKMHELLKAIRAINIVFLFITVYLIKVTR
jgi:hypothetical protein